MEDALLQAINHAAKQDSTWHLVALVALGIFFVVALFKWFTARLERVEHKLDSQSAEFIAHLKTANREMLEVISQNQHTTTRAIVLMDRLENKLDQL